MAKRATQIDKAIESLEQQIAVLNLAVQKLREQQQADLVKKPRKPAIVERVERGA